MIYSTVRFTISFDKKEGPAPDEARGLPVVRGRGHEADYFLGGTAVSTGA